MFINSQLFYRTPNMPNACVCMSKGTDI